MENNYDKPYEEHPFNSKSIFEVFGLPNNTLERLKILIEDKQK